MTNEQVSNGSHDLHLDSLEIRNFRLFHHLIIERLGRVNLFVGKNNVGKTSLLEALWIYADSGNPNLLNKSISARHENFQIPFGTANISGDATHTAPAIRHLYTNSPAIIPGEKLCTQIGSSTDRTKTVELSLGWYLPDIDADSKRYIPYSENGEHSVTSQIALRLQTYYGDNTNGKSGYNYRYDLQKEQLEFYFIQSTNITSIFVSSSGFDLSSTASGWDHVVITDLEDDVLSALQIIEPEIERLNFISSHHNRNGTNGEGRIPFVRLMSRDGWIPLRSLGEGINRILDISVALVNARNGFLLIDEIENGLHYSIQADLWRLLLRVARRLNVQVFATTHNWDCVEAFQLAASEIEQSDGMLIRLQKRGEEIVPILFDESRLSIAVREDIEIR